MKSRVKDNWIYVGSTNDLDRRISEHNNKKVLATKAFAPFEIIYKEEFNNEADARRKEKYFKRWDGRIEKKEILKNL